MDFDDDMDPPEQDPDCYECADSGRVLVFDDTSPPGGREEDCPECCPTPEEAARREAEYAANQAAYLRAVAAGEVSADPWGPF